MNHHNSVFANSCLRVPIDPKSKMPKTAYERTEKAVTGQCSIDSMSTCSLSTADVDAGKLKDFYRSIPDYNDINHLPTEQFYSTLKTLREKKKVMLGIAVDHIDDCTIHCRIHEGKNDSEILPSVMKNKKSKVNYTLTRKYSGEKKDNEKVIGTTSNSPSLLPNKITGSKLRRPSRKCLQTENNEKHTEDLKLTYDIISQDKENITAKNVRPKRIQSACSISWNDAKIEAEGKNEIDRKFNQFFDGISYTSPTRIDIGDDFKTRSMPSSPLRMTRVRSPTRRRKSITVPKPFKMTERDEEERMVNELRTIQKSFSDDMLHKKCERRHFRANPVPIESRIPLYDKILEDQAMRRAITKINSEADLRAQMKPFSFTKREEKCGGGMCDRASHVAPKANKKKRFRARPVPRNLFSNYFYDKMKADDFFRGVNRRIRAEEMLRSATLPGSMAARDRSRLSTPAAHSDLPVDPSPAAPSVTSSDRRCTSPVKGRKKRDKFSKEDFITTSPQPFRFNTADRAVKKMQEMTKKIYQESKSTGSAGDTGTGAVDRVYSALDLRAAAAGRSNLAALLRAEAVRRRFELEATRRMAEQHRRVEMKHRDRQLRSKPAWHLVKNNHEEDIAMRLQIRRDEERMRREEFLHEMELMYGRVQQQPLLFERYYAPRSLSAPTDSIQLSPRKTKKRSSKNKSYHFNSPSRSRKVSINDTTETFNGDVVEYLNRIDHDDISDSEVGNDTDRGKI